MILPIGHVEKQVDCWFFQLFVFIPVSCQFGTVGSLYNICSKLIAMMMTEGEIREAGLEDIAARRMKTRGRRPSIFGKEAKSPIHIQGEQSLWTDLDPTPLTPLQKRRLVGEVIKISITTVFGNYLYSFGDAIFRQASGGPQGDALTVAISRIVMGDWMHNMSITLTTVGMDLC